MPPSMICWQRAAEPTAPTSQSRPTVGRTALPTLFVVATPIGNLGDLSSRAADVLRSVDLVIAEDTRVARKLLGHLGVQPRLLSYHRHSSPAKLDRILAELSSRDAALISDAGTPGVNDPGAELVARAAAAGVVVSPLPGPSAITAALSVSGFSFDSFTSLGYLSTSRSKRRKQLSTAKSSDAVVVFLEAPHRISETLSDLCNLIPNRQVVVCRELTKLHEEVWRGTVSEAALHFGQPRGEFVVVLAPCPPEEREHEAEPSVDEILAVADRLRREGMSTGDLASATADEMGIGRREVYQVLIGRER